jgi:hypothetical protein
MTSSSYTLLCLVLFVGLLASPEHVSSFQPSPHSSNTLRRNNNVAIRQQHQQRQNYCPRSLFLTGSNSSQEEIDRQLEKARAVLAVSRAKMEKAEVAIIEEEDNNAERDVPFFATVNDTRNKKMKVIKDQNKDTGLFTTDGDLMAKLSEQEQWEPRPLLEVFSNERKTAAEEAGKNTFADRDVAASIFNLRKVLQTEDYMKIFDKRNRFIGEP